MIAIGSDHAGFALKAEIVKHLAGRGLEYTDVGAYNDEPCDYPVPAEAVCAKVLGGEADRGVLVCGTGIGISIAANRHKGINAALCHDVFSAKASRRHNDANVLCLGGRVIGVGHALEVTDAWLDTPFEDSVKRRGRIAMYN